MRGQLKGQMADEEGSSQFRTGKGGEGLNYSSPFQMAGSRWIEGLRPRRHFTRTDGGWGTSTSCFERQVREAGLSHRHRFERAR